MTDQTVPVPVELLRKMANAYNNWEPGQFGTTSAMPEYVKDMVLLIPHPPKVGDTLTAEQVAKLPVRSLVVDADGDSWLVRHDGRVLYFSDQDTPSNLQRPRATWGPYTLVYLGSD